MINLKQKFFGVPLLTWIIIVVILLVCCYEFIFKKSKKNKTASKFVEENGDVYEDQVETFAKPAPVHKPSPNGTNVLVFWAPWCGWSKRMMGEKCGNNDFSGSEYEKLQQYCNQNGIKCNQFNEENHKDMMQQYGVSGFPSVVISHNGELKKFPGFAPAEKVIGQIQKIRGETSQPERRVKFDTVNGNGVEVHVFYTSWCGWSKKLMGDNLAKGDFKGSPFEEVEKWCKKSNIKCVAHDAEKEKDFTQQLGVSGFPTSVLMHGDRRKTLPGFAPPDVFIKTVQKFIEDENFKDVPPTPKPEVKRGGNKLTCFYASWCGWSKKMFGDKLAEGDFSGSEFEKIKQAFSSTNLEVQAVDGEKDKELTKSFGVDGFPTCWLQYGDGQEKEFGGFAPAEKMIPQLKELIK
jgi:thioredoxin-related protein